MMSTITETYLLASRARSKLTREANKQDHDLRVLVAHANLLDNLMENIQNNKFESKPITTPEFHSVKFQPFTLPNETAITLIEDNDSSDDEDEDEDYEEGEGGVTEVYYNSDDSDFYSSDEEDEEEEEEDDDLDVSEVPLRVGLQRVSSNNYKLLPTIDELSEQEYEELEATSSSEEEDEDDEEEVDITDLKKTPSLNYSSSTEDDEEYDISSEEEEEPMQIRKQWYKESQPKVIWTDQLISDERNAPVVF